RTKNASAPIHTHRSASRFVSTQPCSSLYSSRFIALRDCGRRYSEAPWMIDYCGVLSLNYGGIRMRRQKIALINRYVGGAVGCVSAADAVRSAAPQSSHDIHASETSHQHGARPLPAGGLGLRH